MNYFKQKLVVLASYFLISNVYATNILEDISFENFESGKTKIEMSFSENATEPHIFTINNPSKIVVDFPDVILNNQSFKKEVRIGGIKNVKAEESNGLTRMVVDLEKTVDYAVETEQNKVFLTLFNSEIEVVKTKIDHQEVSNVDFKRTSDGQGNVIVSFTSQIENVSIYSQGKTIIAEIKDAHLPKDLERVLTVTDFGTPAESIKTYQVNDDIRMEIVANGNFDHIGYQEGKNLTIEIKKLTKKEEEHKKKDKLGYKGRKISLIFQDVEVKSILQLIADFASKNVVTSDSVKGNITLRLKNVPWDQALEIILRNKGLGMREKGNVLSIAPISEIAQIEQQELEANKQIANLLPRVRETIQLNYRNASTVVELLDLIGNKEGTKNTRNKESQDVDGNESTENSGASVVSNKATIIGDDRTNKLIVYDTKRNIDQLRVLVKEIDVPIRQVMIDARIVSASDAFSREFGTNWNVFNKKDIYHPSSGDPLYMGNAGVVNLGIAGNGALGITTGILGGGWIMDMELQAAESDGTAHVISSPRVISSDGEAATIKQGVAIPYQKISDGTVSIVFKEAVLSLDVIPNITPNNKVKMQVKINKDSESGRAVDGTPIIDKQELETSIVVPDGDTIVLGGIYSYETSDSEGKIPFLGDIPAIGFAFKNKQKRKVKKELLIFLTPRVINPKL